VQKILSTALAADAAALNVRPTTLVPTRADMLSQMQAPTQEYDLLVIGGGATGAGIGLDAQTRGSLARARLLSIAQV
jgi:glycerol-3-phosphate dehydrogenase